MADDRRSMGRCVASRPLRTPIALCFVSSPRGILSALRLLKSVYFTRPVQSTRMIAMSRCACPSTCVPVTLCHSLKSRPSRAQSSLSSSLTGIDFLGFFAGGTRALPPTGVGERGAGPMPRGGGGGVAAREEAVVARAAGWSKLAMCHAFVW